jgi:hypothetical protein
MKDLPGDRKGQAQGLPLRLAPRPQANVRGAGCNEKMGLGISPVTLNQNDVIVSRFRSLPKEERRRHALDGP